MLGPRNFTELVAIDIMIPALNANLFSGVREESSAASPHSEPSGASQTIPLGPFGFQHKILGNNERHAAMAPPSDPNAHTPPSFTKNVLYKTEMCKKFVSTGSCRYGAKCQFAHGPEELRCISRHPLYQTSPCKTFELTGYCAFGNRCRFVHTVAPPLLEQTPPPPPSRATTVVYGSSTNLPAPACFHHPQQQHSTHPFTTLSSRSGQFVAREAEIANLQARLAQAQLLLRAQSQVRVCRARKSSCGVCHAV